MAAELQEKTPWQIAEEEYACDHQASILVRFIDAGGRASVRYQCQQCGESQGNVKKNEVNDIAALPAWDESLRTGWRQKKTAMVERIYKWREHQQKSAEAEKSRLWWQNYTAYLRSPEWYALRQFVLKRDNFVCQGCGKRFEQHQLVCHHKSYVGYNRIGKTFAFEVVTLCRKCHNEWHQVEEGYSEYE